MLNDPTAAATAPTTPDVDPEAVDAPVVAPVDAASAEQLEQLLVLSQAPLSLEEALEQEAASGGDPAAAAPLTTGRLMAQYLKLLAQLLGVGLVTASVRHYADGPTLYLGVAVAGAVLFAVASTVLDRRPAGGGKLAGVRFGALSLVLAIGLGLLVGGILHFTAFPHTGAVLVPLGLGLSITAFVLRDGGALVGRSFLSTAVTIVGILVWLGVGLGVAAKKIDPDPKPAAAHGAPAEGAHGAAAGGEHGAAASAGEHGAAPAADQHGATAPAGDHGAPAAGEHGAATESGHGADKPADAAAAKAEHGAAATAESHGAATAEHGTEAKAGEHGAETTAAAHGTEAEGAEHGATASSHGASTSSVAEEKEDEVTADDVLVSRKH